MISHADIISGVKTLLVLADGVEDSAPKIR